MADEAWCWVVNQASGAQEGLRLAAFLRSAGLGTVVDLRDPLLPDHVAAAERVVACGGDGTVAAVLEAARQATHPPPVGILPLGTGNDLAHHLGWSALSWANDMSQLTHHYGQAVQRSFDRWLLIDPAGHARAWYNYCSWGLDARIAAAFHQLRLRHPRLCCGQVVNKAVYAALSLAVTAVRPGSGGSVDGVVQPAWARATVWLNIPRYAGRPGLGPGIHDDDGHVDGFALGFGIQAALAIAGLRCPRRLGAQTGCVIQVPHQVHLQIDGEPLLAQPGTWRILHAGQVKVLVPRSL